MKNFPTISIVTCLFNSDLTFFREGLESIANQHYPKKLIEHIVMDGGSTNGSMELARNMDVKFLYERTCWKKQKYALQWE